MSHRKQTVFDRVTDTLITHARYQIARAMMEVYGLKFKLSGKRPYTPIRFSNRCLYVEHCRTVYRIDTLKSDPLKYANILQALWDS